jgi:hypothetical protein
MATAIEAKIQTNPIRYHQSTVIQYAVCDTNYGKNAVRFHSVHFEVTAGSVSQLSCTFRKTFGKCTHQR